MKFTIRQILIALTLIAIIHDSHCQGSGLKNRLSHLVNRIVEWKPTQNEDAKIISSIDKDCVKNFLKASQSDKILIVEEEKYIFIVGTLLKCSDENIAFRYFFNKHIRLKFENWVDCFELLLKQLEPESKLIENITISEEKRNECKKQVRVAELSEVQKDFEDILGPLDVYSCGAVTGANDYLKFISKGVLIQFGNKSEELKKFEMEKLKEYLKDISFRTIDCIFKRYEDDPRAFLINDTLSYYFEEAMKQVETTDHSNLKETNAFNKKIFDSIDSKCFREQLNLAENGEITLLEIEARIIIGSAMSKCIKIEKYDFTNILLDYGINEYDKTEDDVICLKFHLKKFEPESKLVKSFIINDDIEEQCKSYPDVQIIPFTTSLYKYEISVGELKDTTCGVLSHEDVKIFSYKAVLVATEKDMEVKKSESKELFASVTTKLHKLVDCILEHIK